MLSNTQTLLIKAQRGGYAVGAFNIYNLEGALAVIQTAEELKSPVILQILPSGLSIGGKALVSLCLELASGASVPVSVHLDHCSSCETIFYALDCGFSSVMADGSDLSFDDNVRFTSEIISVSRTRYCPAAVEAELGKLTGEEDGISVDRRASSLTSPEQAKRFVELTHVDALAVCIGNMHGKYERPPDLDFDRLNAISKAIAIPIVLHGTSGLPDETIRRSMQFGVCKFNVNTEVRKTYLDRMKDLFNSQNTVELIPLMTQSIEAMKEPVRSKITLFCSSGRA